jgi:outer membrane protein OmpA-like peptidoglycan-associated protein
MYRSRKNRRFWSRRRGAPAGARAGEHSAPAGTPADDCSTPADDCSAPTGALAGVRGRLSCLRGSRAGVACVLVWSAILLCSSLLTTRAAAQSFRLDRFRAAERPDDAFGVRRLAALGHLRLGANAVADYANDPLVIKSNRGDRELRSIVDHELVLKVDLSLALYDRVVLLLGFDAPLVLKGPSLPAGSALARADGPGFGDVSLGARLRLLGEADDLFGLGVQAVVIAPTAGNGQAYRGEDNVAVLPELIADLRTRPVRVSANLGVLARKKVDLLDREIGSELVYGLALGWPLHARFELLGELRGGFDFAHFGAKNSTGVEWLLGAKGNTKSGFYAGAGAGSGLTRGIGTPDVRAVLQLGYLTPLEAKKEPPKQPAAVGDRDHDGVADNLDQCPDQAEDRDGVSDEDGCPDPDNDGDGVLDADDACASVAEDRDGFADEDGCPELDNDADTVPDQSDACPDEPGSPDNKGCKVEREEALLQLDQVQFENNRDTILEQSFPTLEAVRAALESHPEIRTLRIQGHTDGVGAAPYNMRLSRGRTSSVATWLTSHGIAAGRLQAFGCGELHTIADDATAEGRARNRRVEFEIVDAGAGSPSSRPPQGCTRVEIK